MDGVPIERFDHRLGGIHQRHLPLPEYGLLHTDSYGDQ